MPIQLRNPRTNEYMQSGTINSADSSPWSDPLEFNQQTLPPSKVNYNNLDDTARIYRAVVTLNHGVKGAFTDIQEAINFVAKKYGSGTIFIKKGTYGMTKNLQFYPNIYLVGEDNQLTVLEFNSSTQTQIFISGCNNVGIDRICIRDCWNVKGAVYLTNSSVIVLRNINFISNTASNGSGADIYLDNATSGVQNIEVSFNTSTNSGAFAKLIGNGVQSWFVENNIVSPLGNCFYADPSAKGQGFFLHNYFQDTVVSPLYGNFQNSVFVGNRTFYTSITSTQYQVDLLANSTALTFTGNYFSANGYGGLRAINASNIQTSGNKFGALGTHGVAIGSSTQISFTGNNVISGTGAANDGFNLNVGTSIVMTGNYINATAYGVNIGTPSTLNVVVGNAIVAGTKVLDNGISDVVASNA